MRIYSAERDGQIPPLLLKEEKNQTNSCSCSPEESEQKEKRSSAPRSCGGAGDVQLTLSGETFLGRRGKKEPHVRQHVPNAAQSNILGDPSLQDFSEPFTYCALGGLQGACHMYPHQNPFDPAVLFFSRSISTDWGSLEQCLGTTLPRPPFSWEEHTPFGSPVSTEVCRAGVPLESG